MSIYIIDSCPDDRRAVQIVFPAIIAVFLRCPDTVCIIGIAYRTVVVGVIACDREQLSAVPCKFFITIRIVAVLDENRIPDRVVGYIAVGFLVVDQSVAPAR